MPSIANPARLVKCRGCGADVDPDRWHYGRGRHLLEHPDHTYWSGCGCDRTWFGADHADHITQLPLAGVTSGR